MDCERYVTLFHRELKLRNYCYATIKSYKWHLRQFLESHHVLT